MKNRGLTSISSCLKLIYSLLKPLFVKKKSWVCPLSDNANYCVSGGATALVAVKTLKPGATAQTREDFMRESELMADLRHPNIVCLIGVVTKDEPRYSYTLSFYLKGQS